MGQKAGDHTSPAASMPATNTRGRPSADTTMSDTVAIGSSAMPPAPKAGSSAPVAVS